MSANGPPKFNREKKFTGCCRDDCKGLTEMNENILEINLSECKVSLNESELFCCFREEFHSAPWPLASSTMEGCLYRYPIIIIIGKWRGEILTGRVESTVED